jgi:Antirestriction protein
MHTNSLNALGVAEATAVAAPITAQANATSITCTPVSDDQRPLFLGRVFGKSRCVEAEATVYNWMSRLSPDYHGGYWDFFELGNGGFFLAPSPSSCVIRNGHQGLFIRCQEGNGFEGFLSPQAAGLLATTMAINRLLFLGCHELEDAYYALTDFICEHPEARVLRQALD